MYSNTFNFHTSNLLEILHVVVLDDVVVSPVLDPPGRVFVGVGHQVVQALAVRYVHLQIFLHRQWWC